jgi:transaldolase
MADHQEHDPLGELAAQGVAVWLDDLSRDLLATGRLRALVDRRHVVGVTTNPTIFAAALSRGDRYTGQLQALARAGAGVDAAVFAVTTDDVRSGCDALAPVHQRTAGRDGRVSIEVDPRLSRDATATAEMARRLWTAVDRDNLSVKIPATREGLAAITESISQGISVNVTLIFSLDRYRAVMNAYLDGLEQAHAAGLELSALHSVASFFVSRVDTEVDSRLDRIGARPPRPLRASTGVKDPAYPDTMYVTELVARDTVNTMPGPTLEAFADHGTVRGDTITGSYHAAAGVLGQLAAAGVDFDDVTDQLERDGLAKFEKSWRELSESVSAELQSSSNAA